MQELPNERSSTAIEGRKKLLFFCMTHMFSAVLAFEFVYFVLGYKNSYLQESLSGIVEGYNNPPSSTGDLPNNLLSPLDYLKDQAFVYSTVPQIFCFLFTLLSTIAKYFQQSTTIPEENCQRLASILSPIAILSTALAGLINAASLWNYPYHQDDIKMGQYYSAYDRAHNTTAYGQQINNTLNDLPLYNRMEGNGSQVLINYFLFTGFFIGCAELTTYTLSALCNMAKKCCGTVSAQSQEPLIAPGNMLSDADIAESSNNSRAPSPAV